MILEECLKQFKGRKVRLGAYSAFIYFGIVDNKLMRDMKKLDIGCMKREVLDIYHSNFADDTIIIYDSTLHGRFWFEEEFQNAVKNGKLFGSKEVRTGVKKPKKLTYIQKKALSDMGLDPKEYRFLMEDEGAEGFVHVIISDGKVKCDDDDIVWVETKN